MSSQMPKHIYFRANGDANSYALIDADAIKWLMNVLVSGEHATARQAEILERMAACWNACEGIATSDLERCRDKPADLTLIAPHAIRQRDELIEALKLCKTELHFWMRDHGQDIATQQAISKAMAAIANATKEAP